ncbi:MAG TPA: Hpt domain-containing protein [Bacteroidales bacterium]|jgi:HPt (histidine-containing phosphotransfer) domain-containing protein|nr:Hpt domain-containing protein [Bacteroidales bacterium]MDD4086828.1 Hpt domain-containing protein [Bacteroidales bacterium]MDY0086028.1 Hpt domain-containing protein [Bacteroidales bacterium]HPE43150.1 Hpt domain-containing protein [Bacteroidales bacterium]
MAQSEHVNYSLEKLIGFVGDDPEAIKNMVNLFLNTTPSLLNAIIASFQEGSPEILAKSAHTLKPTLDVFGIRDTYDLIRNIEQKAKRSELDEAMDKQIKQLTHTLELVFQELKLDFNLP